MLEELQRPEFVCDYHSYSTSDSVEEFAQYHTPPDRLGPKHIRQYQAHLFTDRKTGGRQQAAQQLSALRFFFLKTPQAPVAG